MADRVLRDHTYELVAEVHLDGEAAWLEFRLDDPALLEEIRNAFDGSYLADQVDDDHLPPFVSVHVKRRPVGWIESLPEFEGW